jgi:3-hydroxy-9,10-secoandrosta-1,3,5(10)-triene-9,17-dione monooxygenase
LVDRAKELGPALRDRCAETNELRRLPDAPWNDLIRTGILRGLQPARWVVAKLIPRNSTVPSAR